MSDNTDHECTDGDHYYGTREQCPFCTNALNPTVVTPL